MHRPQRRKIRQSKPRPASFLFIRRGTQSYDEFTTAVSTSASPEHDARDGQHVRHFLDWRKRKCAYLIGSQGDLSASAGTTRTMIDEDEGEQHAAAGEIWPMMSIKQVLALIPFSRATLYREMEAGRFPAAHEIAPRRIAWFKDEVASWQLGTKKVP
jgi:prophage regulatory protein